MWIEGRVHRHGTWAEVWPSSKRLHSTGGIWTGCSRTSMRSPGNHISHPNYVTSLMWGSALTHSPESSLWHLWPALPFWAATPPSQSAHPSTWTMALTLPSNPDECFRHLLRGPHTRPGRRESPWWRTTPFFPTVEDSSPVPHRVPGYSWVCSIYFFK